MLVCCQKKCLVLHFCQQFIYLFGLVTAYLSPKDNIIYSKVDGQIKWCSNQVKTVCMPEIQESVNCTVKQFEETYGEPQSKVRYFGRTFDTQKLEAGLYHISCVDVTNVVEQMKLILHDLQFYLDCASAPRALTRFERKQAVKFCVKHIPLRASWIRYVPQLRTLGFLHTKCGDTSGLLPFLNGTLLPTQTWDLISVTFTVLCEDKTFNSTVHFSEPVVSRISQEISNPTAVNDRMGLDLFFSGPRTLSYLLDTQIPSVECSWNDLQDNQSTTELNWMQLNGEIGYEVSKHDSGSSLLTVHNFSEAISTNTFRCTSWAEERCFSKLWIFSQVHPSPEIQFSPLDRVQAFHDILYCNATHAPREHTRARMRVLWGNGTFVTDDNTATWPKLRPLTQSVLLECEAELQYMNITYSRKSESFLAHITSYANISFEPERSVFWATDTLRCTVNNDDPRIHPYIILAEYPTEFHPRLFYETIDFAEFIPGDYVIKCYYFGPNTEKRVLTKNIYVALPPTSIEAEQYVNLLGRPSMRCVDNGYPQSHVSVQWTGPDLTACCDVVDHHLVLSQVATHGVYRVKCDAVVTHSLLTLQLSTDASFVVLGMNFRPQEILTKYMDNTVNKIIIILFSAVGYGLLVLSISATWFLAMKLNKIRSKKRREQKLPPGEYVRVPQNILSKEEQVILIELLSKFDMVAQLVASLVKESRSNKRTFILRGFDWRERRGPRFPDFKDKERIPDNTYSWKTALFSFRPTCLKELHRIHNHKWSGSVGTTSVERFTIDDHSDEFATDRAPQKRKRRGKSSFLRRSPGTKTLPFKRRRRVLRSKKSNKETHPQILTHCGTKW